MENTMDKEIMMEDRISSRRLTVTITKIWWERIIVHIDLQLTYADESLKGEKFDVYAVIKTFMPKHDLSRRLWMKSIFDCQ